jgi:hypothetical protein
MGIGALGLILCAIIGYANDTPTPFYLGLLVACFYLLMLLFQIRKHPTIVLEREPDQVLRDGLFICSLSDLAKIVLRRDDNGDYVAFDVIAESRQGRRLTVVPCLTSETDADALAERLASFAGVALHRTG